MSMPLARKGNSSLRIVQPRPSLMSSFIEIKVYSLRLDISNLFIGEYYLLSNILTLLHLSCRRERRLINGRHFGLLAL